MMIAIGSIKEFESKHGGTVFRLDGHYVNEFNSLTRCYTFIDPKNDNFQYWGDVLHTITQNKGNFVELDNCKMKDLSKGLISADSKPRLGNVYPKPVQPKESEKLGRPDLFE